MNTNVTTARAAFVTTAKLGALRAAKASHLAWLEANNGFGLEQDCFDSEDRLNEANEMVIIAEGAGSAGEVKLAKAEAKRARRAADAADNAWKAWNDARLVRQNQLDACERQIRMIEQAQRDAAEAKELAELLNVRGIDARRAHVIATAPAKRPTAPRRPVVAANVTSAPAAKQSVRLQPQGLFAGLGRTLELAAK